MNRLEMKQNQNDHVPADHKKEEEGLCCCQSGDAYKDCCKPFHAGRHNPATAEALMRSRYSAYVLHLVDYIVSTTVPAQQCLLNKAEIGQWSRDTHWLGLKVHHHRSVGKRHAQVAFTAYFRDSAGHEQQHQELSAFVNIDEKWYFIDPPVCLPTMKQPCLCGSGKKFKLCCGQFFTF